MGPPEANFTWAHYHTNYKCLSGLDVNGQPYQFKDQFGCPKGTSMFAAFSGDKIKQIISKITESDYKTIKHAI